MKNSTKNIIMIFALIGYCKIIDAVLFLPYIYFKSFAGVHHKYVSLFFSLISIANYTYFFLYLNKQLNIK